MSSPAFRAEWTAHAAKNLLAGLTTAFALVPECIAFALVAQLNPLMGLYGACIICAITAMCLYPVRTERTPLGQV